MINFLQSKSVLIIGIAGGLARITSCLLSKKYPHLKVHGIDPRPIDNSLKYPNVEYEQMRYTRGNFERIFRGRRYDVVLHLGRISHATPGSLESRIDSNIMGTKFIHWFTY